MSTLKRVLALSLALMMAMSIGAFADFTDKDEINENCFDAVEMLYALGIFVGNENGTFNPTGTLTRAEAATLIFRLVNGGSDDVYKDLNIFTDVKSGDWWAGAINYCASVGIIAGKGNGIFDPQGPLTGYELAKMLLTAGNYNAEAQGYVNNANWKANIYRDAFQSGLINGYDKSLEDPAPRQWVAKMIQTLVLDVEYARYIGDLLVTGSGLAGTEVGAKTVGQVLLKLEVFEGQLTGNLDFSFEEGADEYDYSTIMRGATVQDPTDGVETELNYAADKALLGQQVKVVAKVVNPNLDGKNKYAPKNLIVLSVTATGDSNVVTTTLGKFTVSTSDDYTPSQFVFKTSGYNGGKDIKPMDVTGITAAIRGADFTEATANMADAKTYMGKNGNDVVTIIDYDDDGTPEYIIVDEIIYDEVLSINSERVNLSKTGSLKLSEVEFTEGTPVRGDYVAVSSTFVAGDEIVNIRVIEATEGVKVTKWTATTAVFDGTTYTKASKSSFSFDRTHSVYYVDGTYIVASVAAKGDLNNSLDTAVGVVTAISYDPTSITTSERGIMEHRDSMNKITGYGFKVQYMGLDGKVATATWYDYAEDEDDLGYIPGNDYETDTEVEAVYRKIGALQNYDSTAGDAKDDNTWFGTPAPTFVIIDKTDDGVTFYDYFATTKNNVLTTGADTIGVAEYSKYDADKGILTTYNNTKIYIADDTHVFYRNKNGAFKLVKGSDLNDITNGTGGDKVQVIAYINDSNTGDAQAIYLYTPDATALPSAVSPSKFAAVTGTWVNTFGLDGSTVVRGTTAYGKDGGFDFYVDKEENQPARYQIFAYTTGSKYHTAETIYNYVADVDNGVTGRDGEITNVNRDAEYFIFNNTRYYYDEDTTILEVSGNSTINALTSPYTTSGIQSAYIVAETNSMYCQLVVINTASNSVAANRLWGSKTFANSVTFEDHSVVFNDVDLEVVLDANFTGIVANVTYQWYKGYDAGDSVEDNAAKKIDGATDATYTTTGEVGDVYTVVVSYGDTDVVKTFDALTKSDANFWTAAFDTTGTNLDADDTVGKDTATVVLKVTDELEDDTGDLTFEWIITEGTQDGHTAVIEGLLAGIDIDKLIAGEVVSFEADIGSMAESELNGYGIKLKITCENYTTNVTLDFGALSDVSDV